MSRSPMLVLQKVQKKVEREVHGTLRNNRELAALRAADDQVSAAIGRAVETTLGERLDRNAMAWVEKIETLRQTLAADQTVVSGVDFGAGSPDSQRSVEEMAEGVRWEKSVAAISRASKSQVWGTFLYHVVRETQPNVCLELGTCVGVSAAYQAAALAVNGKGSMVTIEGAESLARLSQSNLQQLGLDNITVVAGDFRRVLGDVLVRQPRIDYAYIDGHHDEQATLAYFNQILPHVPQGGVVVFDDIRWSAGMQRAWETIVGLDSIRSAVDLFQVGVCVVGQAGTAKRVYKLAID